MPDPNNLLPSSGMPAVTGAPQQGWHQDYRNALMGWHGDRPMGDPAHMADYRQQMQGWHGLRPDRNAFRLGQQPPAAQPPSPTPTPAVPQAINALLPQPPQPPPGMIGQFYGVQGMNPATSPYGLPTY